MHIHLPESKYELAWSYNASQDHYSTKLWYMEMYTLEPTISQWWHKNLWTIKGPLKGIKLFWLVLKERVLTWDKLQ
jgi:hypothetical protein